MKAIRFDAFGESEVMYSCSLESLECGPNEVLVDIEAASVTPGDWKLRAGLLQSFFPVTLPCIPGRDGAGVVRAIGAEVNYVQLGAPVCFVADRLTQGSYAEQIVRDAESVAPLPSGFSFAEGAALVHAAMTAWIMVVQYAKLQTGQKVLIQGGSGAIGSMAIQIARHLGAHVATTCSERNADHVRELGAHEVIAYDKQDFTKVVQDIDVVIDLVGDEVRDQSFKVMKPGSILVWLIGRSITAEETPAPQGIRTIRALVHDDITALTAVVELAEKGVLRPQVSKILPLEEAAQAHHLVQKQKHGRGRIVLDIRGHATQRPKTNYASAIGA